MSEPLSKVLGFEKPDLNKIKPLTDYATGYQHGQYDLIDDLDQLSPDANKLAEIITEVKQHELYDLNLSSQYLAKQIINKMNLWITKPKVFGMDVKVDPELKNDEFRIETKQVD